MNNVRTRVAPSPTGFAHIGTIYQALFDKAYALKNNGKFILRIEDTDRSRFVEGAEDVIYQALEWFNLNPDESPKHGGEYKPYRQSERLDIYKKYAEELVDKGHAYYCFCTPQRLEEVRNNQQKEGIPPMYDKKCRDLSQDEVEKRIKSGEKHVIRMKIPNETKIVVNDLLRGDIEFDSSTVDDQVILKSDGFPTYHLAVVVDDHLMQISHVVRGPEWITSFPKHKLLYDYFGWEMPVFTHTPLISNMDGSKLSKRKGHSSVDWFRRKGYLPEAIINFISLLGWSHPDQKEIFSFEEFVKYFDFKDVSAVNSPKFDLQKLEWMNGQYLMNLSDEEFLSRLKSWLEYCLNYEYHGATEYETYWNKEKYTSLLNFINSLEEEKQILFGQINKERIKKFEDLLPLNEFFISEKKVDIKNLASMKSGTDLKEHLKWVSNLLVNSDWSLSDLKEIEVKIKDRATDLNWKILEVFYPIRIAVCFDKISPPLFESMWLLPKEEVIKRVDMAINLIDLSD